MDVMSHFLYVAAAFLGYMQCFDMVCSLCAAYGVGCTWMYCHIFLCRSNLCVLLMVWVAHGCNVALFMSQQPF